MNLGGWHVRKSEAGVLHVVPIDDLREHEADACWCQPTEEPDAGAKLLVHHSMDLREQYERGRQLM